jgi:hypothetical protein
VTVLEFLSDLAADPSKQLEFSRDPEATARRSGVSEPAIAVLATRDSAALREWLASDAEMTAVIYSPEQAVIYSPERAVIYSPERAAIDSPATAMVYSPQTA